MTKYVSFFPGGSSKWRLRWVPRWKGPLKGAGNLVVKPGETHVSWLVLQVGCNLAYLASTLPLVVNPPLEGRSLAFLLTIMMHGSVKQHGSCTLKGPISSRQLL